MLVKLSVSTSQHTQMVDITHMVRKIVDNSGIREGICTVFSNAARFAAAGLPSGYLA